jgi:chromosome segregation and condensation protein ScpB
VALHNHPICHAHSQDILLIWRPTTDTPVNCDCGYLSEQNQANGSSHLTSTALEVLACIAFKQPISQAEIDRLFGADKRGLVVKLRDLKLVEEFAGADGRLRFATTEAFLQRFSLASLEELSAASHSWIAKTPYYL